MEKEQGKIFKGRVTRNTYNSPEYKVYAIEVDEKIYPEIKKTKYGNVTVFGNIPDLIINQEYEITGVEQQNKYGYGYKVTNIKANKPTSEIDIYRFLQEILTFQQASDVLPVRLWYQLLNVCTS